MGICEGCKKNKGMFEKFEKCAKEECEAKAFDLVNKSFKGNAQALKKLEVCQASLENNSKIIVTEKGISPQLIIGKLELDK